MAVTAVCGAEADGDQHAGDDQDWADDVDRAQRHDRPVVGAGGALQDIAERDHRHGEQAEEDRHDVVALDAVAEQVQRDHADGQH